MGSITLSGSEALFGIVVLILVELSLHLRFKPLKTQLATIEMLLRRDQTEIYDTLGEHSERIEKLEGRVEAIEKSIPARKG